SRPGEGRGPFASAVGGEARALLHHPISVFMDPGLRRDDSELADQRAFLLMPARTLACASLWLAPIGVPSKLCRRARNSASSSPESWARLAKAWPSGLTATPPRWTSKWRCGPVERPVEPT